MLKKRLFILLLIFFILCGCTKKEPKEVELNTNNSFVQSENTEYSDTISIGFAGNNFSDEDIFLSNDVNVHALSMLIFDSLFQKTSQFSYETHLVQSYSIEKQDEYDVWNINIFTSVFFHNSSQKLTAKDCVETINYLREVDNYYSPNVRKISEVKQTGPFSFQIFTEKENDLSQKLVFPIVSAEALEGSVSINTIGTGCYTIDNSEPDLSLKANENWWKNYPAIKYIKILFFKNNYELNDAFFEGRIDVAISNDSDSDSRIQTGMHNTLQMTPSNEICAILLNNNCPVLENSLMRKAISSGINRERIIQMLYPSRAVEATSLQGVNLNTDDRASLIYEYDPLWGHQTIETSISHDFDSLTIIYEERADSKIDRQTAEFISSDLKEMGLQTELIGLNSDGFENAIHKHNYDIAIIHYHVHSFPCDEVYDSLENYTGISMNNMTTGSYQSFLDLEEVIHNEYLIIPLFQKTNYVLLSQYISNFVPLSTDNLFSSSNEWRIKKH